MSHTFQPHILRAYDIRGVVEDNLDATDAYWIGRGFGHAVRQKGGTKVCLGRDGRLTSEELAHKLTQGLLEAGCDVYDIGLGPSPMLYFGEYALETDGAIVVTGSHNPSQYNGFKMSLCHQSFCGDDILKMAQNVQAGELISGQGTLHEVDLINQYVERLQKGFPKDFALKVVWDPGNGAGAEIISRLIQQIPGTHYVINGEADGTFPAHHPDPTVAENLVQLQDEVRKQNADIGLAFDGDADRLGAVDSQGRIFWGDQLLILLARDILARHTNATIIADVKASNALFDEVKAHNGSPLMWKSGHSHIKTKMKETGALLAGEMSGHIFIADDYYGFDDGIYSALRLLKMIWESGKGPSALYDSLPQTFATQEIRIPCVAERKFKVPQEMEAHLETEGTPYSNIDGVRANLPEGWWLLRASNTQDEVVVRCEGSSHTQLNAIIDDLIQRMEGCGFDGEDIQAVERHKVDYSSE